MASLQNITGDKRRRDSGGHRDVSYGGGEGGGGNYRDHVNRGYNDCGSYRDQRRDSGGGRDRSSKKDHDPLAEGLSSSRRQSSGGEREQTEKKHTEAREKKRQELDDDLSSFVVPGLSYDEPAGGKDEDGQDKGEGKRRKTNEEATAE